jgi:hypothetical protein
MRSGLLLLLAHLLQTQFHLVHLQFLALVQVLLDLVDSHRLHLLCSTHYLLAALLLLNYHCAVEFDSFLGLSVAAETELAPDVLGVHQLSSEKLVVGESQPVEVDGGREETGESQRREGKISTSNDVYLRYLT